VRLCVYECIIEAGAAFETHIAQADMLPLIFDSLTDEHYAIREATVCLLARIGHLNPAYIMPAMRKLVVQVGRGESV
jgi:FKBP12-rapamycin complex-associated protein